jgi:ADP-heptose:LPS heptosyltransferase
MLAMFKKYQELSESQLSEIKKILIIQQKPFGDILLNTGYFPELRRKFPDAQIDYLIQRPYLTILEDNPYLDNLVIMEKPKGRGIRFYLAQLQSMIAVRRRKYDLVIDQLRGTSSARIVMFCGAKYRLGYIKKRWNFLFNLQVERGEPRYYSRWKFDPLLPLGIREVTHNIAYHIKQASFDSMRQWLRQEGLDRSELVVFSPGTPVKIKQWHLDNYAALGDKIQRNTACRVVLLWGPGEKEDAEAIRRKMETSAVLAPPTTFNEAGALLNHTRVLITNDGGIAHLAVSQETPSISIFGPKSSPVKWCAWHKKIHICLRNWDHKDRSDNTFGIPPDLVFEKFNELIKILGRD